MGKLDILSNKVGVEDIDYFFKNVVNYDFTDKEFLRREIVRALKPSN